MWRDEPLSHEWYTFTYRLSAYKLKVEGVSPRCGIEQIREGFHPKRTISSKGEVHPSTKNKKIKIVVKETMGTQSICPLWRQAWACLERNVPSF